MDRPDADFEAGRLTVRAPYRVITDSLDDGPMVVCSATGLPSIGAEYAWGNDANPYLFCKRYDPRPIGSAPTLTWKVIVEYSTPEVKEARDTGGGGGKISTADFTNPLGELPEIKMHSSGREELLTQIYDNFTGILKPVTASNGEVFDPPPKTLGQAITIEISRNESIATNTGYAISFQNAVNLDPFFGFAPGYLKFKDITFNLQTRQMPNGAQFPFLRGSYVIEYNPMGWDEKILDYGTYTWQAGQGGLLVRQKIKNADGHPTAAPLNGRGQLLAMRTPATFSGTTMTLAVTTPQTAFQDGDLVQLNNIGGGLPAAQMPGSPVIANLQDCVTFYAVGTGVRQYRLVTDMSQEFNGVIFVTAGTGTHYASCPGVWFTLRKYPWRSFAPLGLPQNWLLVQ